MAKSFIVHEADVEAVPLPGGGSFRLLEDSENSAGLFGANRLTLAAGADGTRPHHHTKSTEIFYVLDGTMEFLVDGARNAVGKGGLVVVPPGSCTPSAPARRGPRSFWLCSHPVSSASSTSGNSAG